MSRSPPGLRADYRCFLSLTTRWMDNDVFGHLNNVVYSSLFDTAVCRSLVGRGILQGPHDAHILMMVESGCRFHSEMAFPDEVTAGIRVASVGTSSVRHEVAVFRNDADRAAAEGFMVHVCVDTATRRPAPWPQDWRDSFTTTGD